MTNKRGEVFWLACHATGFKSKAAAQRYKAALPGRRVTAARAQKK